MPIGQFFIHRLVFVGLYARFVDSRTESGLL